MHQQAGHALQREAQGLHTWHEKLLNAHIACRASADAAPLSGRNSLCADGTWRASIWHEHVGCAVVVRCNGSRQHFELALPVTVCCASCPTSCFGVAVMSESENMQKVPQEKLLLVIRATFFPKSAKQPNVYDPRVTARVPTESPPPTHTDTHSAAGRRTRPFTAA